VKRGRVQNIIIGWIVERLLQLRQCRLKDESQLVKPRTLDRLIMAGVELRHDPRFKRKPARIRAKRQIIWRFRHDPFPADKFLTNHVVENRSPAILEKPPGAVQLLLNRPGDDTRGDQLAMAMLQTRPGERSLILKDQPMH